MTRALVPNFTQVPDVVLDFWIAELSGAELKVVLYVARRTYGFGKKSDRISLSQLAHGIRRKDGRQLDAGTGLSESSVKVACKNLVERGMLIKTSNVRIETGECEENSYELNLNWPNGPGRAGPMRRREPHHGADRGSSRVGQSSAHPGQKVPTIPGRKSATQDTEDLQETAAGENLASNAAADLVTKLITNGMNGIDADRLARTHPHECRIQLRYHAHRLRTGFAFKRGPGAFLRRAIEEGYAPPEGYLRGLRSQTASDKARLTENAELARVAGERQSLSEALDRLKRDHPDAFSDFLAYADERKQAAANRPLLHNAPSVRSRLLTLLDREEHQQEFLRDYFASGRCPSESAQGWFTSEYNNVVLRP